MTTVVRIVADKPVTIVAQSPNHNYSYLLYNNGWNVIFHRRSTVWAQLTTGMSWACAHGIIQWTLPILLPPALFPGIDRSKGNLPCWFTTVSEYSVSLSVILPVFFCHVSFGWPQTSLWCHFPLYCCVPTSGTSLSLELGHGSVGLNPHCGPEPEADWQTETAHAILN